MNPKIVVIGSANTDMVVRVDHIPEPGETILGGDFMQSLGGKGANQAVAAARLGADVTFIGRLGVDALGDASIKAYRKERICTDHIFRDSHAPSGVALIMVDDHGENIIAVAQGANSHLSPDDVHSVENVICSAAIVLIQMEIPLETVVTSIQLAAKNNVPVILNPAPAIALPPSVKGLIDFLTPNQNELYRLAENDPSTELTATAQKVKTELGIQNMIITLGKKGAQIMGDKPLLIPAFSVHPVDTTGAGDAFNGGLAVSLGRGEKLEDAVRFANAVAALSTTREGAQSAMPTREEVDRLLSTSKSN
jgi:ribokinase